MKPLAYRRLYRQGLTLSSLGDRLALIKTVIKNTAKLSGEIWECGAYKGGTALYMAALVLGKRPVRIFDTFEGLPDSGQYDIHPMGAMKADYNEVKTLFDNVPNTFVIKGVMPNSFVGLENCQITVAHIDVDQYHSLKQILAFVYPRMVSGGYIVIDDYNCGSCPGAKIATDEFMSDKPEKLVILGKPNPQVFFQKI